MPIIKTYTVINPEGKKISFTNASKFCEDNDLNRGSISNVIKGKLPQHKGYTALPTNDSFINSFLGIKCPV